MSVHGGPNLPCLNEEQDLERERWAWHYRVRGWPYQDIAEALTEHHDLPSNFSDVARVLARRTTALREQYLDQAMEQRLQQVLVLERHARRAFEEFERSTGDLEVTSIVTGRATLNRDGDLVELPDITTRTVRAQSGQPALLSAGFEALAHIRRILGYNAPEELRIDNSDTQAQGALEEKLKLMAERLESGELPELPAQFKVEEEVTA